jgi:two-component system, NarL family, sensor histidine kinase UhpB
VPGLRVGVAPSTAQAGCVQQFIMDKELNILIVEDIPSDAAAIEEELHQGGVRFRAQRVETRDQFLAALREGPPDIIISDFNLPTFDGLEALRLVQESELDRPFILVTGPRSEEVAVECMREGADDYILKDTLKRLPSAVSNALRKKAAERERAWAEAELRRLSRLIVDAQETERRRVARELHDSVNQVLSSVKFRLQAMEERLQERDEGLCRDAVKARQLMEKAIEEVIRISRNLRPSELDDLGLVPAIRSLCEEFSERSSLAVTYALPSHLESCSREIELALYRIVQEALTNVEKHAHATSVDLALTSDGTTLCATIRDNGSGFVPHSPPGRTTDKGGMGLMDMQERARNLGGACVVASAPGQGTEIRVTLPCDSEPNSRPRSREKKPNRTN